MADVAYGSLPFREQIAFFRNKTNILTNAWTDVWQEAHDFGFMVAGVNRMDMLIDFRDAVDRAIAKGETLEQFRARFDTIVAKYGWDYNGGRNWRSRVIYETNLRTSYAAGRWQQLQALKKMRPYWRYRHYDAEQYPRPEHEAWDGLVLSADDAWWHTHFPPGGWGCKCYVEALNERDLKRLGKTGPDTAPPIDMQTVTIGQRSPGGPRTVQTPAGIDPGFGYAPGKAAFERATQNALVRATDLPASASAAALQSLLALPRVRNALDAVYDAFQAKVIAQGLARNESVQVGALEPRIIEKMITQRLEPATAPIVARDVEILHALRDAKTSRAGMPIALTPEELARLPSLLRGYRAVLLDPADDVLLYIVDASTRREAGKIVVAVNYRLKTATGKQQVNAFRTASLTDIIDVRKDVDAGKLILLAGSLN